MSRKKPELVAEHMDKDERIYRTIRWLRQTEPVGMPVQRFAELAQVSPARARELLDEFWDALPNLKTWSEARNKMRRVG